MAENMIKFLRGNVASLPATATAGAVYFTKDEGLYLGLEDGTYHRYGDFITVANVATLPEAGAHETCMYYCESENILAKWSGTEWVQINKQKTLAELGGVAKSVYDAKVALLEQADTDNATAISNLSTYVGTIPATATATDIVGYVQEKTAGIATDTALEELTGRVAQNETDIKALQEATAEGGSVTTAIGAAQAAADAAQADVDALELKVGTIAEGKTVAGLISDAQTAADGAQSAADKAQGDVDALAGKVGAVEEGKTVVGLIETAQTQADKGVADAATAQAKAESAYTLAEGKATMEQVNAAISGAGHAVKAEVDASIEQLGKDYVAADTALETKLQGNIDKKVDQTAYDAKVKALDDEDARLAGLISGIDTAYQAADTALDGRVAALEGTITGLTGAMHFKGVKDEVPTEVAGYADGDVIIVGEKEYVFNDGAFVEFGDVSAEGERIGALEAIVGKAAEGENAATGLVKAAADNAAAIVAEKERAEGVEADLAQADIDNLAEAKKYTDDEIAELNISQYAKQSDLDTHTGNTTFHITADERTAWNAAEGNAKTYADGLNTAMNTRVEALEAIDHDHSNKGVLDGITGEKVTEWNTAYTKAHEHANAAELNKIADGDVAKWNSAQANAEATAAAALAGAKTELEGKITAAETAAKGHADTEVGKVQSALDTYKTENNAAVALKANAADVYTKEETYTKTETYTKAEVEAMLTWGSF